MYWITVTLHFRSFSGTEEERIAVETACRYGSKASAFSSAKAEDVSVEVTMDGQGPTMGNDAELTITLRNRSSEKRTVALNSQVVVMYYTGIPKATVRKDSAEVEVLPSQGEWVVFWFSWRSCRFWHLRFLCYHILSSWGVSFLCQHKRPSHNKKELLKKLRLCFLYGNFCKRQTYRNFILLKGRGWHYGEYVYIHIHIMSVPYIRN